MDRSGANEDTYPMLVISRLITVTYLPIYWNGKRLNPRTSTSSICNFNLLHCWRNLESILTFTCIRTFLRFSPKPYRRQYYVLTYFRRDPVADELWVILGNNRQNIILDFNMLVKTLWNLVMTTFDNIGYPTSFSRSTSYGSFTNLTI